MPQTGTALAVITQETIESVMDCPLRPAIQSPDWGALNRDLLAIGSTTPATAATPVAAAGTAVVIYVPRDECGKCPFGNCKKDSCVRKKIQDAVDGEMAYEETRPARFRRFFQDLWAPVSRIWRWVVYAE